MIVYTLAACVCVILYSIYYYFTRKHNYWKERNVPHLQPSSIFGNYFRHVLLDTYAPQIAHEICQKFPKEPYVGVYYGSDPALIVKDPELIKLIISKDFYYFNLREVSDHTHKEIVTQNMFFTGGDRWKVLRQNLSPLFSSKKLKNMFYLINNCAKDMERHLDEEISDSKDIEIRSLLARYTMDCVGSCVFGANTGTLDRDTSSENPFIKIGAKIFDISFFGGLKVVIRAMWPSIFYGLRLKLFTEDITNFFKTLLTGVFTSREYKESGRNDFVDLLLKWKQKDCIFGDSISNVKTGEKAVLKLDVDDELIMGQCVMFFAAGYETTATTTSFLLYELAKHVNYQSLVIEEVDEYFKRHDGLLEFEAINEMPFLQACIDETLRLYPVLGVLTREVFENYTLPTGLCLEKGTRIHIPVYHLHHNPEHFPDPEQFRPQRFLDDEKANLRQFTYLPFGEGPRICLGMRFAKMPMFAGLLTILKNYRVEICKTTPSSYKFLPRAIVTQPNGDIRLKFISRKV